MGIRQSPRQLGHPAPLRRLPSLFVRRRHQLRQRAIPRQMGMHQQKGRVRRQTRLLLRRLLPGRNGVAELSGLCGRPGLPGGQLCARRDRHESADHDCPEPHQTRGGHDGTDTRRRCGPAGRRDASDSGHPESEGWYGLRPGRGGHPLRGENGRRQSAGNHGLHRQRTLRHDCQGGYGAWATSCG